MPKELEEKLRKQSEKKGYAGKREDRYVYGTMNVIEHNRAGGPEKVLENNPFKKKSGDTTKPSVANVHPVGIGITIAVIVVLIYAFRNKIGINSIPSPAQINPYVPTAPYPPTANYQGWISTQYNPLGASAGALYGEGN